MSLIKYNVFKYLIFCIVVSFIITFITNFLFNSLDNCKCENYGSLHLHSSQHALQKKRQEMMKGNEAKKMLAVVVPFRDRFDELLKFVPHMSKFLNQQNIPHHIFVVNQADRYRFNRAALINVGFLYIRNDFDYIAMHDVDLLPLNSDLKYEYPIDGPFHIASPGLHPKYNYPTFIGGILLLRNEHFEAVNGMSCKYWGWGLEDDEFYVRLADAKLKVLRPEGIQTGSSNTFNHIHDRNHRRRDTTKCFNQKEETRKRDKVTGLSTIKYKISNSHEMSIDGFTITVLNVNLECNRDLTPWCDCIDAPPKESSKTKTKKGL